MNNRGIHDRSKEHALLMCFTRGPHERYQTRGDSTRPKTYDKVAQTRDSIHDRAPSFKITQKDETGGQSWKLIEPELSNMAESLTLKIYVRKATNYGVILRIYHRSFHATSCIPRGCPRSFRFRTGNCAVSSSDPSCLVS